MSSLAADIVKLSKTLSQKSSAPNIIAETLREAMLAGKLRPGERVVETRIAQELGVGQPTVREALVLLEHEGLLVRRPNKGCSVIELSYEDIDKIFRVRLELEPLAVELAKEAWEEPKSAPLLQSLEALKAAAEEHNVEKYYRCDLQFHETLWRLAENVYLERALSQITVPLFSFATIRLAKDAEFDLRVNAATHAKIALAVISPKVKVADARQITRRILKGFWDLTMRIGTSTEQ